MAFTSVSRQHRMPVKFLSDRLVEGEGHEFTRRSHVTESSESEFIRPVELEFTSRDVVLVLH